MYSGENERKATTVRSRSEGRALSALAFAVAMIASSASAVEPPADSGSPAVTEAAGSMAAVEVAMGLSVASLARPVFGSDAAVFSRHGGGRHGHAGGSRSQRSRCAGGRATCR